MTFPADIILRSVVVYVFILIAIRLFGKKEFSQLTIIDLVFILLISNSVQNAMVGSDSTLLGGIVAAASLFVMNYLLKILLYRNKGISKLLQGSPVMLIHEGKVLEDNMRKERITIEELELAAREHGVKSISKVNLAVLELDGSISILSDNYQKHTKRKRRAHKSISSMN
jgi:uncharacterized membrane protein YcaP (DUF421 family)